MSISTTNINDLPVKETNEKNTNISNETYDNTKINENELITGLQRAAASGATLLSSRDIPMDQSVIHEDKQIKANYIPQSLEGDYITKHQTSEEIIRQNAQKQQEKDKWDDIYAELSIPIFISALYFMYQLPAVRKLFINYIPMGYGKSGDINLTGRILNCIIFGIIVYASGKIITQLSK